MSTAGSDYNGNSNKKRQNGVSTNTSVDKQGVLRDNNGKHIKPNTATVGMN
jgi:hypothetical protein